MTIALLILVIGLTPALLSAWVSLRSRRRVQARFQLAVEAAANQRFREWVRRHPDEHYVDGLGFVIGDITCNLNARSPYLRCAVNPAGPCTGCRAYEEKPSLLS
ncbi:MAG: DUF6464 family protein [Cyanobacteria bacterium P01_D01_bin.14]